MPIARSGVFIDTLHPVHEGRIFRWDRDKQAPTLTEYGRTQDGDDRWLRSPFYHLLQKNEGLLRRRLLPETDGDFSIFPELRASGHDGLHRRADALRRQRHRQHGLRLFVLVLRGPDGFRAGDISALQRLTPFLALAIKSASLARIAGTLVETYLGRDAGKRVLSGRIERGVTDRIEAVLWYSDLRGYTKISDTAGPEQIIPLLNDYAEAVISAIHAQGGDVLKLIGDGHAGHLPGGRSRRRLPARADCRQGGAQQHHGPQRPTRRRRPPVTEMYLGLHVRRGVLRQYRQHGAPGLHRRRPGGQRGQPHRVDVPLSRSMDFWCRRPSPSLSATQRSVSSRSDAMRCAAWASARPLHARRRSA